MTDGRSEWMLYGAYGRTGRLILDEALRRGHRPVLAGRDGTQLAALGRSTGLTTRCVPLEDGAEMRAALSDVRCVLLAAGPYQLTGPARRRACLDARRSYLDVNGELDDFSLAMASDADARAAGIAIIAGAGYGVVFGECLAAHIKGRLPNATSLRLSLATTTAGRSRGATLSSAAAMVAGGRDIYHGALRTRAIASPTWRVKRADGSPMRFAAVALRIAAPLLGRILARAAAGASTPGEQIQSKAAANGLRSRIWAHASDAAGNQAAAILEL